MKFDAKLSLRARLDRERRYEWYSANYSHEFAERWFLAINAAIESLSSDPGRYSVAAENDKFPFELQEMLFGSRKNKHRILFTVIDDVVNVLHIRHSAQQELGEDDI